MKILITGAAGYLGRGIVHAVADHHDLRLLDVAPMPDSPHEVQVGSVEQYAVALEAVRGVDAIILSHMAPRKPGVYDTPQQPFAINVTGTANLYAAAAELGVRQIALISSIAVVDGHRRRGEYLRRDLPPQATDIYGLTKVCQEAVARHYYDAHGIASAMLRPSYVQDADTMADKYGRVASEVNWHYIDRRDIGKAARLAVERDNLGCEPYYLMGHPRAFDHVEMQPTYDDLNWTPDHDFTHMPYAESKPKAAAT